MQNLAIQQRIQAHPDQLVYFCGDVHGDKKALEYALSKVGFVEQKDILIMTGDIIDRGSFSWELVEYVVNTPNIYSVIGNHESCFLSVIDTEDEELRNIYTQSGMGGYWIEQYSAPELKDLAALIRTHFPLSITVQKPSYSIGVIHAAAPDDWSDISKATTADWESFLWDRGQYEKATKIGAPHTVKNIDAVVHGHVCNCQLSSSGNHLWIDTLFHSGNLTVIEAAQVDKIIAKNAKQVR